MAKRTPKAGSNEARGLERHVDPRDPAGPMVKTRVDMSARALATQAKPKTAPKTNPAATDVPPPLGNDKTD